MKRFYLLFRSLDIPADQAFKLAKIHVILSRGF